jgi:hypothetical protein
MTRADLHSLALMLLCLALIGIVALAFDGGRLPRRIARSRRKGQQIKSKISQPCAVRPAQFGTGDAAFAKPVVAARVGVRPPARATFSPVIRPTTGDGGTDCSHPGAATFPQPESAGGLSPTGSAGNAWTLAPAAAGAGTRSDRDVFPRVPVGPTTREDFEQQPGRDTRLHVLAVAPGAHADHAGPTTYDLSVVGPVPSLVGGRSEHPTYQIADAPAESRKEPAEASEPRRG